MKRSPITICHLILMIILLCCSTFSVIAFFCGFDFVMAGHTRAETLQKGFSVLMVIVMLFMGIMYLLKEYSKQASFYYKAFLIFQVVVAVVVTITDDITPNMSGFIIAKCVLYAVKIVGLLLLAFWKNLGKQKTMIIFYIIFALDVASLVLIILNMMNTAFEFSLIGPIAALVADGTLGLAIRGKYMDKEERKGEAE